MMVNSLRNCYLLKGPLQAHVSNRALDDIKSPLARPNVSRSMADRRVKGAYRPRFDSFPTARTQPQGFINSALHRPLKVPSSLLYIDLNQKYKGASSV
jgi:hypothetical protein